MKPSALTVLVIEDEKQMRRFLRSSLPIDGYAVIEATTGRQGIARAASENPQVVLLDLGLPDMDGIQVTRELREWSEVPLIVLSARDQEGDKIAALDAGANDYLTKPFGVGELLARMRVARRHMAGPNRPKGPTVFVKDNLRVDLDRGLVFVSDNEVHLTPIEYKLLVALVRNAGRVLTHHQLLKEVWGARHTSQTQYLHVYIGHLRSKLESDSANPKLIVTESGVGYRLRDE